MLYYYDSKGAKYKGKIRICEMCSREDLVTIYNLKKKCKLCASKTRKDAIHENEVFIPQKNRKYKLRGIEKTCERCEKKWITRKDQNRKTKFCPSCASSTALKKKMTGLFGNLNYGYKNGSGFYRRVGILKNNGQCIICNSTNKIHVHHIDKNRKNNIEDNLIPLCSSCHYSIHEKIKKGMDCYQALAYVSNQNGPKKEVICHEEAKTDHSNTAKWIEENL